MKEILEKLNLSAVNPGSWSGTQSMQTDKEKLIESINPSSKEVIASVINTNNDEYEQIIKNAQEAAKLCIINGLAQLNTHFGTLENIKKIIRISGFVNSTSDFSEQPKIINHASDLLFEIFGDSGKHSRVAVGVSSLPLNSTVEIDMVVEISN